MPAVQPTSHPALPPGTGTAGHLAHQHERLRQLFDHLAGSASHWAPLAASPAITDLVAAPATRLAHFAPDPLAPLEREPAMSPIPAGEGAAEPSMSSRRRTQAPAPLRAADVDARRPGRSASLTPGSGQPGPSDDMWPIRRHTQPGESGAWAWPAARPGARVLAPASVPVLPPQSTGLAPSNGRNNDAAAASPAQAAQASDELARLVESLAPATSTPVVTADQLRAWALVLPAGQRAGRSAATPSSAFAASSAPQVDPADMNSAALADLVGAATSRAASGQASSSVGITAPGAPSARASTHTVDPRDGAADGTSLASSLAPRGRQSALADLLRRWPAEGAGSGIGRTATDVSPHTSGARGQIGQALAPPAAAAASSSAFSSRPAPVSASLDAQAMLTGAHPLQDTRTGPAAAASMSDLQFGRSLERVLVAELRRHGIDNEDRP